jgi:hypothetical protein
MQLASVTTDDGAHITSARVTLGTSATSVLEFDVGQLAAFGSGLESLLLAMVGMHEQSKERAEKATRIAAPNPHPIMAGV